MSVTSLISGYLSGGNFIIIQYFFFLFFFGFFWVFLRGIKDGKKSILTVNYPLKEPVFYHIHTASEGAVLMAAI